MDDPLSTLPRIPKHQILTMTIFVGITDILAWGAIALCALTLFNLWVIETIKKHIKRK